jgi:4-hydroxy-L-threonine phosphate dehydrogenase PdxA
LQALVIAKGKLYKAEKSGRAGAVPHHRNAADRWKLKVLRSDEVFACCLGTPVIFATVGHGVAFDIVRRHKAFPTSLTATIKLVASVRADTVVLS